MAVSNLCSTGWAGVCSPQYAFVCIRTLFCSFTGVTPVQASPHTSHSPVSTPPFQKPQLTSSASLNTGSGSCIRKTANLLFLLKKARKVGISGKSAFRHQSQSRSHFQKARDPKSSQDTFPARKSTKSMGGMYGIPARNQYLN